MRNRDYDAAEKYYGEVGKAPWPDYKMRAKLNSGRVQYAKQDYPAALENFKDALASEATGEDADEQRLSARLGKATVLAATGKSGEGLDLAQTTIRQLGVEDAERLAQAFNALGVCQLAAGRPKNALEAFLTVDVLYSRAGDEHAEALHHLHTVWTDLKRPERASEAQAKLQSLYPHSRWNKP